MRGALSGLLAAAAVLASNAKEFKFRAPARGEKYNTTRTWDADAPITVHIMPHTHDDVGWLKTVDQYATGANMSIQFAWVNTLITTMTEQLALNPDRTAIYVEQAFYQRWWNQATDVQRNQWRDFIANGQAEFVGGGWCMPDEANEHVWAGVDQFTLGNALLMGQFGPDAMPTTLAQWDPFGHTAGYSYLMGSEAGMDGMYYGRQDYQERETRKNESSLEYVWRPSDSLGEEVQLFAHTDFGGNYQPFPGLNFDINQHGGQIQDSNDPTMQLPNNVQYYVDLFVQEALKEANSSRTGQILFTAGSDFQYTDAISWYRNLDRLIHYVNQQTEKTGVRAQYNTLRGYTKASNAAALKRGVKFSVDTYDLMNYRDSEHAVWSGYFVSRPSHKGYIRDGQRMLRAASILNAASEGGKGYMDFQFARQAQGVVQHHDSVTGTAKQHVTFDYFKRISTGMSQTGRAVSSGLAQALNDPALENKLTQCFRANESVCAVTQASSTGFDVAVYSWLGRSTSSVVRLPIEGTQATVTQIGGSTVPSQVEANMAVPFVKDGASHSVVFVATTPGVGISTYRVTTSSSSSSSADFEHKLAAKSKASKLRGAASAGAASSITNGVITVHFDAGSGRISGISNDKQGVNMTAAQDYVWYNSSAGNGGNHPWGNGGSQPSGAYIFRPNRSEPFAVGSVPADGLKGDLRDTLLPADDLERMGQLPPVELSIEGSGELGAQDLVVSATQKFSDWLTQTVRLYDGFDYVELETTVGPIPFEDGLGKEIVSRWKTDVTNGDDCVLKADSNGRDFMTRRLNYRPTYKLNITEPVAENYYPLTAAAYIQDGGNGRVFGILSDRAQSVASLDQGEIETMVHRRVLQDDRRGVGEPLNETTGVQYHPSFERLGHGLVIRYVQRITVGKGAEGVRSVRSGMDDMFARPVVSVAAPGSIQGKGGSVLKENLSLPENIFIANCDYFNDSSPLLGDEYHEETGWPLRASSGNGDGVWLVRLAHQYGKGEHPTLSQNVTIDLVADLLGDGAGRGVVQVEETTMFAHRRMQDVNRLQWPTEDGSVNPPRTVADPISYKAPAGGKASPGDVKITLWPMKIRTFLVRVQA